MQFHVKIVTHKMRFVIIYVYFASHRLLKLIILVKITAVTIKAKLNGLAMEKTKKNDVTSQNVKRLRKPQDTIGKKTDHSESPSCPPSATIKSKHAKPVGASERTKALNIIIKQLILGDLTQGQALKLLRVNVLGLKQEEFALLVKVSRKTISEIENDRGSYNTDILNNVFKIFNLQVGLLPINPHKLIRIISDE